MLARTFILLLPVLCWASEFDGRWDITAASGGRKPAWWLEVKGSSGSFVGAPGGQVDKVPRIQIENGNLGFTIHKETRTGPWNGVFAARLVDGKLKGTLTVNGKQETQWTGVRAPSFGRVDPAALREGKPVELFNGRDLTGWRNLHPDRPAWKVVDGVMVNSPGATDLVSTANFWNFKLHAEYRVADKSNSGIGLRGRYEIQIYGDHGAPPSDHGNGALYNRIAPAVNATKPASEWQVFDITLVENRLTVVLNGKTLIDNREVEGITAIANNSDEGKPGPIIIQGDHGSVEFRKIRVTPLEPR